MVGLSLSGYFVSQASRFQALEDAAHTRAGFVATRLDTFMASRLVLTSLIRDELESLPSFDEDDYRVIVAPMLNRFPDIQAINWVSGDGVIVWVNPLEGNEPALGLDLTQSSERMADLEGARSTDAIFLTPPIMLAQGGSGYASYTPVQLEGRIVGYINLVFRTDRLVHDSIDALDLSGFRLTIADDGAQILEFGSSPSTAVPPASKTIAVMNRNWAIQVEPTQANAARQSVKRELFFLIGGTFLSIFVTALIWLYLFRRESQRNTERRFRDYLEVSSDWFWETDENLRWSYFSDKYEDVSGVKATDLLGKTREEVGAPGADPRAYRQMLNDMHNRRPFRDFVHTREKNGSLVYLSISAKPAFDEDGQFLGYRGVGREVTEFYRNRRDLDEALVRAERASQAKSEFLATMSHEFRTPLNAILGFSDILKSQLFGPIGSDRYSDYAENIYSSGAHMLNLVDDILDISAIEAGKRQLEVEQIDLGEIFKVCARTMESRVREKDLNFTVFESDPAPIARTDRRALLQILLNLLSNAVKFTPPKGRVSLAMETAEDWITITVEDSGVGIPEDMLQEIMEPFVQSANDPLVTGTGSGLGLSIVKSLCAMIGATVTLTSTQGKGTTVRLSIPVEINEDLLSADDKD